VALSIALTAFLLAGCVQEMENQPRIESLEGSHFFADGLGSRPQVPGTIARGQAWETTPVTTGKDAEKPVEHNPVPITSELLERGQMLFHINCRHCHGPSGYGDGIVVQRGFPSPPSYHIDRLRDAPDGRLFEVITQGHGRMPPFKNFIAAEDRWAIVAYVRALQLSQHAERAMLSNGDLNELEKGR